MDVEARADERLTAGWIPRAVGLGLLAATSLMVAWLAFVVNISNMMAVAEGGRAADAALSMGWLSARRSRPQSWSS
jgi:hypothetical protein